MNEAQPITNNRTMRTDYVNEDPINIMYDCNVAIRMRNLELRKATVPKRLPFILINNILADLKLPFSLHILARLV